MKDPRLIVGTTVYSRRDLTGIIGKLAAGTEGVVISIHLDGPVVDFGDGFNIPVLAYRENAYRENLALSLEEVAASILAT